LADILANILAKLAYYSAILFDFSANSDYVHFSSLALESNHQVEHLNHLNGSLQSCLLFSGQGLARQILSKNMALRADSNFALIMKELKNVSVVR
jgi:hypothetical protein